MTMLDIGTQEFLVAGQKLQAMHTALMSYLCAPTPNMQRSAARQVVLAKLDMDKAVVPVLEAIQKKECL